MMRILDFSWSLFVSSFFDWILLKGGSLIGLCPCLRRFQSPEKKNCIATLHSIPSRATVWYCRTIWNFNGDKVFQSIPHSFVWHSEYMCPCNLYVSVVRKF